MSHVIIVMNVYIVNHCNYIHYLQSLAIRLLKNVKTKTKVPNMLPMKSIS